MADEHLCRSCGHLFPWRPANGPAPVCPRCGSPQVDANPWLLCQSEAEGISHQDHFMAGLVV